MGRSSYFFSDDQEFQQFLSDFLQQSSNDQLLATPATHPSSPKGRLIATFWLLDSSRFETVSATDSDHSLESAPSSETVSADELTDDRFKMRHIDPTGMSKKEYQIALAKEKQRIYSAKSAARRKNDPEKYRERIRRQRESRQRLKSDDPKKYQKKQQVKKNWNMKIRNDPEKYQKELERNRKRYSQLKNDPEKYQKKLVRDRDRKKKLKNEVERDLEHGIDAGSWSADHRETGKHLFDAMKEWIAGNKKPKSTTFPKIPETCSMSRENIASKPGSARGEQKGSNPNLSGSKASLAGSKAGSLKNLAKAALPVAAAPEPAPANNAIVYENTYKTKPDKKYERRVQD